MQGHKKKLISLFKQKWIWIILLLFFISATISFLGPVSGDGCWHMAVARYVSENNVLPILEPLGRTEFFWPPFLFHMIMAGMFKLSATLGFDITSLLLPLAYLGTLILTYKLAKEDFGKKIATTSILFLGTVPIFLDFSTNYFIGVLLAFFVIGAVYLAKNRHPIGTGFAYGLAAFTKLTGVSILPLLIFLFYKRNFRIRDYIKFFAVSSIGLIPYIRNYLIFKNPVWPFLNNFFNGVGQGASYSIEGINFNFSIYKITNLFLGIVGVPHGNLDYSISQLENVIGFNISFFIILFLIIEILFLILIFCFGLKYKIKNKFSLVLWILCFIPIQIVYFLNFGATFARFFIPAFPAVAIIFGVGMHNFSVRYSKYKNILPKIVYVIFLVFILTVVAKHFIATKGVNYFQTDYDAIGVMVPKDSVIYYNSQCLSMRTHRFSKELPLDLNRVESGNFIYFNSNNFVEPRASLDSVTQNQIIEKTGCDIIYSNEFTGTRLCQVK